MSPGRWVGFSGHGSAGRPGATGVRVAAWGLPRGEMIRIVGRGSARTIGARPALRIVLDEHRPEVRDRAELHEAHAARPGGERVRRTGARVVALAGPELIVAGRHRSLEHEHDLVAVVPVPREARSWVGTCTRRARCRRARSRRTASAPCTCLRGRRAGRPRRGCSPGTRSTARRRRSRRRPSRGSRRTGSACRCRHRAMFSKSCGPSRDSFSTVVMVIPFIRSPVARSSTSVAAAVDRSTSRPFDGCARSSSDDSYRRISRVVKENLRMICHPPSSLHGPL